MGESTEYSKETLARMAATIRNLLQRAEDPRLEFEAERQAFLDKAESLMAKYRIAEEEIIAEDATSIMPIARDITITRYDSEFYIDHFGMWVRTAEHTGVRFIATGLGGQEIVVTVVGYESDIRYAEGLYMSAWMTMAAKLEPKVDPNKSDAENVYALRSAGIARNRIAQMLWSADPGKAGHAAHARVGRLYAEACAARGENPVVAGRGINKIVFRESYASSFGERYAARLRAARDATDSIQKGLVLHGRANRVDEEFYRRFPSEHPEAKAARRKAAAEAAGNASDNTPAKRSRPQRWTRADQAAYERRYLSPAAQRGSVAGEAAADSVRIDRTAPAKRHVEHNEPSGLALGN